MIFKCPHCGNKEQYYRVARISGKGAVQYRFDGMEADNTNMHDNLSYVEQKKAFCSQCHKEIRQLKKILAITDLGVHA